MSTIESNEEVNLNTNDEVVETNEETQSDETTAEETKDEKHFETPEAKRARLQRQLAQLDKKYPVEDKPTKSTTKSDDLDYGQKAFLVASGVKGSDEVNLVKDIMANTGKTLEQVLDSKYFQSELSELREAKATSSAVPSGTKRSNQSSQDTVDYWIAKGELPTDRTLRQKVVNARIAKETNKEVFGTNN